MSYIAESVMEIVQPFVVFCSKAYIAWCKGITCLEFDWDGTIHENIYTPTLTYPCCFYGFILKPQHV